MNGARTPLGGVKGGRPRADATGMSPAAAGVRNALFAQAGITLVYGVLRPGPSVVWTIGTVLVAAAFLCVRWYGAVQYRAGVDRANADYTLAELTGKWRLLQPRHLSPQLDALHHARHDRARFSSFPMPLTSGDLAPRSEKK